MITYVQNVKSKKNCLKVSANWRGRGDGSALRLAQKQQNYLCCMCDLFYTLPNSCASAPFPQFV